MLAFWFDLSLHYVEIFVCILVHDYTLCFIGSPCCSVSYYYISIWPYYIVIHSSFCLNVMPNAWDLKAVKWCNIWNWQLHFYIKILLLWLKSPSSFDVNENQLPLEKDTLWSHHRSVVTMFLHFKLVLNLPVVGA